MKSKIKFPFLLATLAMLALVVSALVLNVLPLSHAVALVVLFRLVKFALSQPRAALFLPGLTPDEVEEFQEVVKGLANEYPKMKGLTDKVATLERIYDELAGKFKKMTKAGFAGMGGQAGVRWIGPTPFVTDDCAKAITAVFVLDCSKMKNGLEAMVQDETRRNQLVALSCAALGIEQRTAMSTAEIPIPTVYAPQIIELVFANGQARNFATVFPLGSATVKLPRLKAGEDDFGYLGVGAAGNGANVPEKRVAAELVTFTPNKAGGIIRLPFELEEDTFIPIGQFLARYIARQLAKLEDRTLFLADGTSTFANQTGVGPYCAANGYLLQLTAGNTKPSDATLDDFRNLRALVSAAVLGNMIAGGQTEAAYYLSPTFEPLLRSFNKYPNFVVFEYVNGKPMLDGWPVRWIGVSQAYKTTAAAATFIAFFGALSYWYLGERGTPRIEVSREVFFATDELAMRALERIDVEVVGVDAMAVLQTAAA